MKTSVKRLAAGAPRAGARLVILLLTAVVLMQLCGRDAYADDEVVDAVPTTLSAPARAAGSGSRGDGRDVDMYPAIAFDPVRQLYLMVWMSARHAGSSSDGFDVYGIFLDGYGRPVGEEFRISDNTIAARNRAPTLAVDSDGFVVMWAETGRACQLTGQRVTDSSRRTDWRLTTSTNHSHSPSLIYHAARRRFVVAYVVGDDYLPPSLFGAETSSCGNNAGSRSYIGAIEFSMEGAAPSSVRSLRISAADAGAFRPHIAYQSHTGHAFVVWEDRRSAAGAYRFDVYGQRLAPNLTPQGANLVLESGGDYTNGDTPWTPRPVIAAARSGFLAAWFAQSRSDDAAIWSVRGVPIPAQAAPGSRVVLAEMTFLNASQPPTGFLSAAGDPILGEYLVAMTNDLDSIFGYFSSARIQRVGENGQLIRLNGTAQPEVAVGSAIDYDNDAQISVAVAYDPTIRSRQKSYMIVYSRHAPDNHSQNFDIWRAQLQLDVRNVIRVLHLPFIRNR